MHQRTNYRKKLNAESYKSYINCRIIHIIHIFNAGAVMDVIFLCLNSQQCWWLHVIFLFRNKVYHFVLTKVLRIRTMQWTYLAKFSRHYTEEKWWYCEDTSIIHVLEVKLICSHCRKMVLISEPFLKFYFISGISEPSLHRKMRAVPQRKRSVYKWFKQIDKCVVLFSEGRK